MKPDEKIFPPTKTRWWRQGSVVLTVLICTAATGGGAAALTWNMLKAEGSPEAARGLPNDCGRLLLLQALKVMNKEGRLTAARVAQLCDHPDVEVQRAARLTRRNMTAALRPK